MRILIAGASGFVGSQLSAYLKNDGHEVVALKRHPSFWDPERGVLDEKAIVDFDVIINLAGESVVGVRWTRSKKQKIRDSRVQGTLLLAQCINHMSAPPKVFISASAIGYYGSQSDHELTEQSPAGMGFLAGVCQEWEAAALSVTRPDVRVVLLRFGHVLRKEGGLLKKLIPIFRLGLGGKIGSGRQWMSWVAMEDVMRAVSFLMVHPFEGAVNIVAPNPVTNEEFTKQLAETLHRPAFCTVPACILRLLCGKMASELFLSSARVFPERLQGAGFAFLYSHLTSSLLEKLL